MSSLGPNSRYLSARQSNRNSDNDQSRDDGTNWYPEEPTDLGNCLGLWAAEGARIGSLPLKALRVPHSLGQSLHIHGVRAMSPLPPIATESLHRGN